MLNMKQLRYVAVLAQYNNFTRAAEELGISQPSLSQYVKKIEKQIGTDLFIRAGQDVRLSDAGRTYLQIGQKILTLESEMTNRLVDITNDQAGTLTIGIAPYRCTSLMPRAVKMFREFYPGIKVILSEQITSELKESAERGKLDLCVSTLPIDEGKFVYHKIMAENRVLAVPKKFCENARIDEADHERVSIHRFSNVPFVSLPDTQVMGQALLALCERAQIHLNVVVECQDLIAVHAMVEEGIGAALLPYSLVSRHECESVSYYSLEEATESREIIVFYRKEQYISKPMQKMIEILTNTFETERWTNS